MVAPHPRPTLPDQSQDRVQQRPDSRGWRSFIRLALSDGDGADATTGLIVLGERAERVVILVKRMVIGASASASSSYVEPVVIVLGERVEPSSSRSSRS